MVRLAKAREAGRIATSAYRPVVSSQAPRLQELRQHRLKVFYSSFDASAAGQPAMHHTGSNWTGGSGTERSWHETGPPKAEDIMNRSITDFHIRAGSPTSPHANTTGLFSPSLRKTQSKDGIWSLWTESPAGVRSVQPAARGDRHSRSLTT